MNHARAERISLCSTLDEVGPDAPTLCEGWTTYDLAAHLLVRESDPVAAPGIAWRPLAHITAKHMDEAKRRHAYPDLVDRVRRGPGTFSLFSLPGADEAANTIEFFVHHADVLRAQASWKPRELSADMDEFLWRRLRLMARVLLRKSPVGLVIEHERTGEQVRVVPGDMTVTIIGTPAELTLFSFGRSAVARVRRIGEPEALHALDNTHFVA